MIDTAIKLAGGLIDLAKKQVDPCKEATVARSLAADALGAFEATGRRRYHRAYLNHKRMARFWSARCGR